MDETKFSSKLKFSHLNLVDLVVAKVEDLKLAQVGEEPSPDLKFQQNYPDSEFGFGFGFGWLLLTFASRLWLRSSAMSLTWSLRIGRRSESVSRLVERLRRSRPSRGERRPEGREERELFCSISF